MQVGDLEQKLILAMGRFTNVLLAKNLPSHTDRHISANELLEREAEEARRHANRELRAKYANHTHYKSVYNMVKHRLGDFIERDSEGLIRANLSGEEHARVWAETVLRHFREVGQDLSRLNLENRKGAAEFLEVLRAIFIHRIDSLSGLLQYFGCNSARAPQAERIDEYLTAFDGLGYLSRAGTKDRRTPVTFKFTADSELGEDLFARVLYPLVLYSQTVAKVSNNVAFIKSLLRSGKFDYHYKRVDVFTADDEMYGEIADHMTTKCPHRVYQGDYIVGRNAPLADFEPHIVVLDMRHEGSLQSFSGPVRNLGGRGLGIYSNCAYAEMAPKSMGIHSLFSDPHLSGVASVPTGLLNVIEQIALYPDRKVKMHFRHLI